MNIELSQKDRAKLNLEGVATEASKLMAEIESWKTNGVDRRLATEAFFVTMPLSTVESWSNSNIDALSRNGYLLDISQALQDLGSALGRFEEKIARYNLDVTPGVQNVLTRLRALAHSEPLADIPAEAIKTAPSRKSTPAIADMLAALEPVIAPRVHETAPKAKSADSTAQDALNLSAIATALNIDLTVEEKPAQPQNDGAPQNSVLTARLTALAVLAEQERVPAPAPQAAPAEADAFAELPKIVRAQPAAASTAAFSVDMADLEAALAPAPEAVEIVSDIPEMANLLLDKSVNPYALIGDARNAIDANRRSAESILDMLAAAGWRNAKMVDDAYEAAKAGRASLEADAPAPATITQALDQLYTHTHSVRKIYTAIAEQAEGFLNLPTEKAKDIYTLTSPKNGTAYQLNENEYEALETALTALNEGVIAYDTAIHTAERKIDAHKAFDQMITHNLFAISETLQSPYGTHDDIARKWADLPLEDEHVVYLVNAFDAIGHYPDETLKRYLSLAAFKAILQESEYGDEARLNLNAQRQSEIDALEDGGDVVAYLDSYKTDLALADFLALGKLVQSDYGRYVPQDMDAQRIMNSQAETEAAQNTLPDPDALIADMDALVADRAGRIDLRVTPQDRPVLSQASQGTSFLRQLLARAERGLQENPAPAAEIALMPIKPHNEPQIAQQVLPPETGADALDDSPQKLRVHGAKQILARQLIDIIKSRAATVDALLDHGTSEATLKSINSAFDELQQDFKYLQDEPKNLHEFAVQRGRLSKAISKKLTVYADEVDAALSRAARKRNPGADQMRALFAAQRSCVYAGQALGLYLEKQAQIFAPLQAQLAKLEPLLIEEYRTQAPALTETEMHGMATDIVQDIVRHPAAAQIVAGLKLAGGKSADGKPDDRERAAGKARDQLIDAGYYRYYYTHDEAKPTKRFKYDKKAQDAYGTLATLGTVSVMARRQEPKLSQADAPGAQAPEDLGPLPKVVQDMFDEADRRRETERKRDAVYNLYRQAEAEERRHAEHVLQDEPAREDKIVYSGVYAAWGKGAQILANGGRALGRGGLWTGRVIKAIGKHAYERKSVLATGAVVGVGTRLGTGAAIGFAGVTLVGAPLVAVAAVSFMGAMWAGYYMGAFNTRLNRAYDAHLLEGRQGFGAAMAALKTTLADRRNLKKERREGFLGLGPLLVNAYKDVRAKDRETTLSTGRNAWNAFTATGRMFKRASEVDAQKLQMGIGTWLGLGSASVGYLATHFLAPYLGLNPLGGQTAAEALKQTPSDLHDYAHAIGNALSTPEAPNTDLPIVGAEHAAPVPPANPDALTYPYYLDPKTGNITRMPDAMTDWKTIQPIPPAGSVEWFKQLTYGLTTPEGAPLTHVQSSAPSPVPSSLGVAPENVPALEPKIVHTEVIRPNAVHQDVVHTQAPQTQDLIAAAKTDAGKIRALMNLPEMKSAIAALSPGQRAQFADLLASAKKGSFTSLNDFIDNVAEGGYVDAKGFTQVHGMHPDYAHAIALRKVVEDNLQGLKFNKPVFDQAASLNASHLAAMQDRPSMVAHHAPAKPVHAAPAPHHQSAHHHIHHAEHHAAPVHAAPQTLPPAAAAPARGDFFGDVGRGLNDVGDFFRKGFSDMGDNLKSVFGGETHAHTVQALAPLPQGSFAAQLHHSFEIRLVGHGLTQNQFDHLLDGVNKGNPNAVAAMQGWGRTIQHQQGGLNAHEMKLLRQLNRMPTGYTPGLKR